MIVTTIYAFNMPIFVHVQIKGVQQSLTIPADKVQREGDKLTLSKNEKPVGEFNVSAVEGWWITGQDKDD